MQGSGTSKYEGQIESVTSIDGEEETLVVFKLRLVGKERLLNGTVLFVAEMNDSYVGMIDVHPFKNGEWAPSNIKVRTTPCDVITNFMVKYFIAPDADCNLPRALQDCDLKAREYYFKKIKISTDHWPPFLSRGLNKFTLNFSFKDKRIGGFEIVHTINDKHI